MATVVVLGFLGLMAAAAVYCAIWGSCAERRRQRAAADERQMRVGAEVNALLRREKAEKSEQSAGVFVVKSGCGGRPGDVHG